MSTDTSGIERYFLLSDGETIEVSGDEYRAVDEERVVDRWFEYPTTNYYKRVKVDN